MSKKTLRILVTGGGSSGHISPALAIIKTIEETACRDDASWTPQILYIGGQRGLERQLVEAAGVSFVGVETGKLRRYLSRDNLTDALRLPVGVAQSLRQVRRFQPHVVFATGGYVAVPPVVAAWLLRVPIIIHEQTVQIGLANRITSRFATRIALSFESALDELSPSLCAKAFVTGNPVRPVIFGGERAQGIQWAKFSSDDNALPTVYVTGGSQGSRLLNRAVESALPDLLQCCRVIHQCGRQPAADEQDYDRLERVAAQLSPQLRRRYHFAHFIGAEIKHVFALSDLVLGRAGAGTVTELCALGKAALYVPLVPTGGDEQTRNAKMCEQRGAAIIIPQAELDAPRLLDELKKLLSDPPRLQAMGRAALTLAKPHAARDVADAIIALAQQHPNREKNNDA